MWQTKRKVADASANNAIKLDIAPAAPGRTRRKSGGERAERQLRKFVNSVGSSIENLIDATPFGVPTPEPWNASTDKKKAMLSNPISVLNSVSDTIDALCPAKLLGKVEGSAWMIASSKMLMSLREGLAAAVKAEEAMGKNDLEGRTVDVPVMVEKPVDATISSETGEAFVDIGADQWGNTSRAANPVKEAVLEAKALKKVTMSKMLALIDNLTLRANGIVVTSDDCSVECSLSSLVDDGEFEACSPYSAPATVYSDEEDFEDCPSVVTEIAMDDLDNEEDDTEVDATQEDQDQVQEEEVQEVNVVSDEEDFVMTEEPDSDEEDFVDVRAELDITYCP